MSKPVRAAPLVGRLVERGELLRRLEGERLVSLIGPGGAGKTRLALDVMEAVTSPAVFVSLDQATATADVVAAVARALGVPGVAGEGVEDQGARVGRALAERGALLLVCDNLEQVLDAAGWIGRWLDAAPELSVLATSRAPLALAEESVIDLGPMAPEGARALFMARARAAGARLSADEPGVDALLARLDRLPLAIELAAARSRMLRPAALLARLEAGHIGLGRGKWRDRPSRQADLATSFAWSWRLLTPDEQADLTRCAVFRGPFDADAAMAVLVETELDGLADLLDHSLVQRVEPDRFALFATVRAFALREGPDEVRQVAVARHRGWYLEQGRRRAVEAHGPRAAEAQAWLLKEQGNIVAAITAALDAGASVEAVGGLRALRPLVYTGAIAQAYDELLERACTTDDPGAAGWARCLRGELSRLRGRLRRAQVDLEHAAGVEGLPRLRATAQAELGIVAHELGDLAQAAAHHQAALTGFEAIDDHRGVGRALGSVAITRHARGNEAEARDAYEQALDLLAEVGDRRSWAIFTSNLGDLHLESDRLGEARACYEDARRALLALGDHRIAAAVTGNLGGVLLAEGHPERAIERRVEAVEALLAVGDQRLAAVFRGYLGLSRHIAGDLPGAVADYTFAERVLAERGDRRHAGVFAAHRAAALAASGDVDGADEALAQAEGALAVLDEPAVRAVPTIHRGHVHLARGDRASAEASLRVGDDQGEDQKMARRLLRLALGAGEEAPPPVRIIVAQDGSVFDAPGVGRVDLGRRYTLHRLLAALVEVRLRSPGAGLELDALREAGWPGERMSHASGANRVYVAIATLRREGLSDVLVKRPEGYMLDPAVPLSLGAP